MSDFPDLDEFFDPAMRLTIRGVEYVINPPSVKDGIKIRLFFDDPKKKGTGLDRLHWMAKLLGATFDPEAEEFSGGVWSQMEADGCSAEEILRAGNAALLRWGVNSEVAQVFWGPDDLGFPDIAPEKEVDAAGNRSARRARAKKKPKKATSSKADTASTTPAPEH
ncbi:hypothetical protein GCM10027169_13160 [Gordonia jinhuaensis]|uniref:DUF7426 domain-containing protein n=1 Tax=Gordonia jinhuaensis TaxID=1517702 RepID=A0A916WRF2_9ACTN|nr:hypothetical protein [Gordonia jinhuaensis]GGB22593.1 hypothetical protein GCM10011489_08500 [Gordonia jinhuaensis]